MRTSAILVLVGLAAGSALGQNTFLGQNPVPKSPAPAPPRFEFKDLRQFKGRDFRDGKSWIFVPNPFSKFKLPGANPLWFNAGKKLDLRTNVCAVPLRAAPIPKEAHFSTPVLPGEKIDRMPEAQLPAPSCGDQGR
jgi:hypothetical protein